MRKLTVLLCATLMGAAACYKNAKNSTPAQGIVGKWQLTQTAQDNNQNGIMDTSEIVAQPVNFKVTLVFDNKGNLVETEQLDTTTAVYTFKWLLENNNKYLLMIAAGKDTVTRKVESLNYRTMILEDTVQPGIPIASWAIFTKQ